MIQVLTKLPRSAYDEDFYAWTQQMAEAIRAGDWSAVDLEALAEEIEDLGKRDRRAIKSRLEVLLMHLLKWQFQPELRCGSWQATILEQRLRLQDLLDDSPSLRAHLIAMVPVAYENALELAASETGLAIATFPQDCLLDLDRLLDRTYFPEV
jgi:Domain of unknown function DUF29